MRKLSSGDFTRILARRNHIFQGRRAETQRTSRASGRKDFASSDPRRSVRETTFRVIDVIPQESAMAGNCLLLN